MTRVECSFTCDPCAHSYDYSYLLLLVVSSAELAYAVRSLAQRSQVVGWCSGLVIRFALAAHDDHGLALQQV